MMNKSGKLAETLYAIRFVFSVFSISLCAIPTARFATARLKFDDDATYYFVAIPMLLFAVLLTSKLGHSRVIWLLSAVSILTFVGAYGLILAVDRPTGMQRGLLNLAFMGCAMLQFGMSVAIAISTSFVRWFLLKRNAVA